MDVKINVEDVKKLKDAVEKDLDFYRRGLRLQMARALNLLKASAMQNIRTRSGLRVRSGSLLNSLVAEVVESNGEIIGTLGTEGVPYAAVHEFGHTFKARRVEPRNASVLAWEGKGGKMFFSKGHNIPSFTVPARPYLRPAMEELRETIAERFGLFLGDTFKFER